MVCPPQGGRWRLPAEDVLAATGCRAGKRVEGNAVGPADDLHDPLSLPGDETSTMRCRINLHDALSVRTYGWPDTRASRSLWQPPGYSEGHANRCPTPERVVRPVRRSGRCGRQDRLHPGPARSTARLGNTA